MYPYNLSRNPYHSSPTPRFVDSTVLGGQRHKEAKTAILSCLHDVCLKMSGFEKDLRVISIIQDVGSGKTHLALHLQSLQEVCAKSVISYVDFSQILPRNKNFILSSILNGFRKEELEALRRELVGLVLASQHDRKKAKLIKKIFNHGLFAEMLGGSLEDKTELLLQRRFKITDFDSLSEIIGSKFSEFEREIIFHILNGDLEEMANSIVSLSEMIELLCLIINLNHQLLNKVTIFQFDEFDSDGESMEFIKAIINFILPSSMIMLIMTPAFYDDIRKKNISLYDRLEKANYKIDLAGSNTFGEINDIVLEYIRSNDSEGKFTIESENDLSAKIKIIYDEFADFRNVRSMINILYHATELAANRNVGMIDEQALDEAIRAAFPGLRIKGSIMSVPVSEFMKIRKTCRNIRMLEDSVRDAVRDLVQCTEGENSLNSVNFNQESNELIDINQESNELIDIMYCDSQGERVAVSVALDKERYDKIDQTAEMSSLPGYVNKMLILTDKTSLSTTGDGNGTRVIPVNMDDSKLIDLIYFSSKYRNNQISDEDLKRASMLAKAIKLP
jgi:hypothetical protein